MKKTYKTETNHGDFSLLAHIVTQVWDSDPEIKCMGNFAAKWTKTCNFEPKCSGHWS